MDLRCNTCGEPWDVFTLTDEGVSPSVFAAKGCEAFGTRHGTTLPAGRRALLAEMSYLLGDDIDGLASELEDAEAMGLL